MGKGKFLKAPKVTMTAGIMQKSKRKPGPTSYSMKAPMDIRKGYVKNTKTTEEKYCSFIEDARVASKETPGHKFNIKHS